VIVIRDYGDKRSLVVYTDQNDIYHKLVKSTKCANVIPYYQEKNGKLKMVGIDLYFPKKHTTWLFAKTKVTTLSH